MAKNKVCKVQYKFTCFLKENHNTPVFGVQFNPHLQEEKRYVFATVGSNRISIYECLQNGCIRLLQAYADPDCEESFYSCVWTYDTNNMNPLLAAGGARGIIRLISPASMECTKHFKGHGNSINDLKVHPFEADLLLSVSKDHSIRLWNIRTDICIAIFGGVEGHRDEVLCADFHLKGNKIVSSGMDHSLKIWSMENENIQAAIKESHSFNTQAGRSFKTQKQHFPIFTTRDIHRNYVDCVQWFGNFVLSKSCENAIICWKPGKLENATDIGLPKNQYINDCSTTTIHRFEYKESDIWFIRFSMDEDQKIMAVGNQTGKIYVWDLDVDDPSNSK
ncbi:polycomb protein EED-like protein [Dinothrombium tinctorium]|uniref:Polycomb protein esc n=1 Tax=Dinothrombium tinctorium TaxID=1965070 RepID=A0A443RII0_9ACAR|nr:polycomb protein EED-like protein [Dinothrombium tinctorium]RWS15065.1 polycomb protein EED-like protein [Dinothrombium tinctorium]